MLAFTSSVVTGGRRSGSVIAGGRSLGSQVSLRLIITGRRTVRGDVHSRGGLDVGCGPNWDQTIGDIVLLATKNSVSELLQIWVNFIVAKLISEELCGW